MGKKRFVPNSYIHIFPQESFVWWEIVDVTQLPYKIKKKKLIKLGVYYYITFTF